MKKQIVRMSGNAFATCVIAIGSASVAQADQRIVAKVPFAFIVGDMRLPGWRLRREGDVRGVRRARNRER